MYLIGSSRAPRGPALLEEHSLQWAKQAHPLKELFDMADRKDDLARLGVGTGPNAGVANAVGHAVSALGDKARDAASGTAQKVEDLASGAADKMRGAARTVANKAEDLASGAADKMRDAARTVAHKAEDAVEATKEKAGELVDNFSHTIRRHPTEAILLGLGVGFLLGLLLPRR
jgi:ElaB/YqjD/DUF883 family membrane-anchored ribosome-binding protein